MTPLPATLKNSTVRTISRIYGKCQVVVYGQVMWRHTWLRYNKSNTRQSPRPVSSSRAGGGVDTVHWSYGDATNLWVCNIAIWCTFTGNKNAIVINFRTFTGLILQTCVHLRNPCTTCYRTMHYVGVYFRNSCTFTGVFWQRFTFTGLQITFSQNCTIYSNITGQMCTFASIH